jgi:hypothetical protein
VLLVDGFHSDFVGGDLRVDDEENGVFALLAFLPHALPDPFVQHRAEVIVGEGLGDCEFEERQAGQLGQTVLFHYYRDLIWKISMEGLVLLPTLLKCKVALILELMGF